MMDKDNRKQLIANLEQIIRLNPGLGLKELHLKARPARHIDVSNALTSMVRDKKVFREGSPHRYHSSKLSQPGKGRVAWKPGEGTTVKAVPPDTLNTRHLQRLALEVGAKWGDDLIANDIVNRAIALIRKSDTD